MCAGCEHNGKFFNDGDRIPNAESPCYSCYCHGSSITCALADCKFRFDCEPEYVPGECCPRYDHCPPDPAATTLSSTRLTSIFTTLPTTTLVLSTNATPEPLTTVKEVEVSSESAPTTAARIEGSSEPATTLVNELVVEQGTTMKPHQSEGEMAEVISNEQPMAKEIPTTIIPEAANEVNDVVVTAKVNVQDTEAPKVTEVALVEDTYPTTKTWIPDSSLKAEHKEDDLIITTAIPAIEADALDSVDINGEPAKVITVSSVPEAVTTLDSQTTPPVTVVNVTDTINVISVA